MDSTSSEDKSLEFLLITAVPEIAQEVERAGVGTVFLDMETLGKYERQENANTPINAHTFEDVRKVKAVLQKSRLLLRLNPYNQGTEDEVEQAIDSGADALMLPYAKEPWEIEKFCAIVNGRAKVNFLFETSEAVGRAEQMLSVGGFDEVHFGLNDLRISLGLDFLFESFAGGLIEWLCSLARERGISYGIGGVGRVGKEMLPAELIIGEHVRLGSDRVILSRVFHGEAQTLEDLHAYVNLEEEIAKIREVEDAARKRSPEEIERDRLGFVSAVYEVAETIRKKAGNRA